MAPCLQYKQKASQVTLGKCIWTGSQEAAKFTEQVNMQVDWEVGSRQLVTGCSV